MTITCEGSLTRGQGGGLDNPWRPRQGRWLAVLGLVLGCSGGSSASVGDATGSSSGGDPTATATGPSSATVSWELSSAQGPPPRHESGMAALGDRVVLFGGRADATHFLGDTWIFDGTTWTELEITGPAPRGDFGFTAWDGAVWLYGGVGRPPVGSLQRFTDLWRFDGDTWALVDEDAPPGPRQSFGFTGSQGGLVVTSGVGEGAAYVTDAWRYDGTWTPLEIGPGRRRTVATAVLGDIGYVIGGATPGPSADVWATDGVVWTSEAPLPYGIAYHAACPLGDYLLIFGGIQGGTTNNALAALWAPSGAVEIEATPSPRSAVAASALGPRCVLFGGQGEGQLLAETWIVSVE